MTFSPQQSTWLPSDAMINLIEETKDYWRDLDALEAAYQQGEISIEEVDARVAQSTERLTQKRREACYLFVVNITAALQDQKETVLGLTLLSMVIYIWFQIQ